MPELDPTTSEPSFSQLLHQLEGRPLSDIQDLLKKSFRQGLFHTHPDYNKDPNANNEAQLFIENYRRTEGLIQ